MGQETGISWCHSTFNPWHGCTKISPGCDNCYAETLDKRFGEPHWGKGVPRKVMSDAYWKEPLKWNRLAAASGKPWRVFCASMADVMDDEAPAGQRERLWELIDNTPNLTWLLLTKRPTRYTSYLPPDGFKHGNVWLGTSAENHRFYEVRWSVLRIVSQEFDLVSFVSYEPALGPLRVLEFAREHDSDGHSTSPDWLICGGESGSGRRPMEQSWAEDVASDCEIVGTKFWMKQLSAQTPAKGADLIPAHLLIHEFPNFGEL
jgi:protein gp37